MRLFYSYSHADEAMRDKLDKHLTAMRRIGVISDWHDRKILPGDDLDAKINEHLQAADIILFLVSADFLASRYIWDVEVSRAMERHNNGEARVIPIILRPVELGGVPFERLIRLPKDGLPVTEWHNDDLAFANIAQGLSRAVMEMSRQALGSGHPASAAFIEEERFLDYGVSDEIPVGESREVLAMIRRADSPGLDGVLSREETMDERYRSYSVRRGDVRSTAFRMFFASVSGRFGSDGTDVKVELRGPGVDITDSPTAVVVRRAGDTSPLSFLIRSSTAGKQTLKVRVICDEEEVINGLMRTSFVHHGGGPGGPGASARLELDAAGRRVLVLVESELILRLIGRAQGGATAVAWG